LVRGMLYSDQLRGGIVGHFGGRQGKVKMRD
jgi:hypothetical protein